MTNCKYSILFLITLFCFACSGEEDKPNIPDNFEIDVNEDGEVDFEIKFREVDLEFTFKEDDPDSRVYDRGIFCTLESKNENSVYSEVQGPSLFTLPKLMEDDTIVITSLSPFVWDNTFAKNISEIKRFTDSKEWQQIWSIIAGDMSTTNQYLALRIESDGSSTLCWIELEISLMDGSVNVINQNCVQNTDLVIGR